MKYVCPQCDYHGDTIRGIIPTECWSCGAKLPEHLCRKCGSEMADMKLKDCFGRSVYGQQRPTRFVCKKCSQEQKVPP